MMTTSATLENWEKKREKNPELIVLEHRNFMQPMGRLKFPMGSHQVFNRFPRFPMCSPRVFPIAPHPYVLPKVLPFSPI
jgi:hypothetical protein